LTENKEEKPKVELVQSKEMTPLFTIEICEPVKEQLDKINFCGPNIVVKPCNPINEVKCIPDMAKLIPDRGCQPVIWKIVECEEAMKKWASGEEIAMSELKVSPLGCIPRIWFITELVYSTRQHPDCMPIICMPHIR
jgi:hypothetical protein